MPKARPAQRSITIAESTLERWIARLTHAHGLVDRQPPYIADRAELMAALQETRVEIGVAFAASRPKELAGGTDKLKGGE